MGAEMAETCVPNGTQGPKFEALLFSLVSIAGGSPELKAWVPPIQGLTG